MESEKPSANLAQTLNVGQAVVLATGIVIGSGLLILPGLVYFQAGTAAVYAWIIDAIMVIPLLVVFGTLGSSYPNAGGVAGFVRTAFGSISADIAAILLMGAFFLGIPGIALTGANYFGYLWHEGALAHVLESTGLLVTAGVLNYLRTPLSKTVQQILSYTLVLILIGVSLVSVLFVPHPSHSIAPPGAWVKTTPVLGMVFFAFTGWEMLSFMGEEFRNPKRDFPLAIIVSFLLVVFVYVGVALAIQRTLPLNDIRAIQAPIAAIMAKVLGRWSGKAVAIIGVLIILTNLNGAIWAASRLLFSSAREGLLPKFFAGISPKVGIPRRSVFMTTFMCILVVVIHGLSILSLHEMFSLAGKTFFLLYLFSALAYLRLFRNTFAKIFGLGTFLCCLLFAGSFGVGLLYPLSLVLLGLSLGIIHIRSEAQGRPKKNWNAT